MEAYLDDNFKPSQRAFEPQTWTVDDVGFVQRQTREVTLYLILRLQHLAHFVSVEIWHDLIIHVLHQTRNPQMAEHN